MGTLVYNEGWNSQINVHKLYWLSVKFTDARCLPNTVMIIQWEIMGTGKTEFETGIP